MSHYDPPLSLNPARFLFFFLLLFFLTPFRYSTLWPNFKTRNSVGVLLECGLAGTVVLVLLLIPTITPSMRDARASKLLKKQVLREKESKEEKKEQEDEEKDEEKDAEEDAAEKDEEDEEDDISSKSFVRSTNSIQFFLILLVGIAGVLLGTHFAMDGVDGTTPIHYLVMYILSRKLHAYYLVYWCIVLAVGVVLIGAPEKKKNNKKKWKKKSKTSSFSFVVLPQIIHRKLFHLLALFLFVPPVLLGSPSSVQFLSLSIGIAMSLALLLELVRIGRVPPFGRTLHHYVQKQIDERDEGLIVLTHMYLLAGCGVTMWLCPASLIDGGDDSGGGSGGGVGGVGSLVVASGLIATGIGDAMGATVGASWGDTRHTIVGTRKSWEGSFAMLISMVVAAVALCGWEVVMSWSVLVPLVACTIVEACTTTIDNLVLPMVLMTGLVLGCC